MNAQSRTFQDAPAVRKQTPLFIGLFAPTGAGKTYSALRLATGVQHVVGGEIFAVDTESNRMLHYADKFKFRHVPFSSPFSPLDYIAALNHCVERGAKTIIVDSATHEHEGEGGVLEWHDAEAKRLAQAWGVSENKTQIPAWGVPKAARRRLISRILQINANVIFCFRAREKLKLETGKDPVELGFMPIGGEELFYEMTVSCLLLPMEKGVPHWTSQLPGERMMMKLPEQFEQLFGEVKQLDESIGEQLAAWAAGGDGAPDSVDKLVSDYGHCSSQAALQALEKRREKFWTKSTPANEKQLLVDAANTAKDRLRTGAAKK